MTFSERMGYVPARSALQVEDMDDALRNDLWNVVKSSYWLPIKSSADRFTNVRNPSSRVRAPFWMGFFAAPVQD